MAQNTKKLREGLANLFKAHEAMSSITNNKNRTSSSSRNIHTREVASPNTNLNNISTATKNRKSKKTNIVEMEQGRGPLNKQSSSTKLNGAGLHKERNSNKRKPSSDEERATTSGNSFSMQDGVKNSHKSRQSRNYGEVQEDHLKSRNKAVNGKNLKPKTSKVKESKAPTNSKDNSKNQSSKIKKKGKQKGETATPVLQQATCPENKAKKRRSVETEAPAQKKFKANQVFAPANEMEVWKESELDESDTTEIYSDSNSMLESDYDSDLDDTFDLSDAEDDDYESYDEDSDEYSLSDECSDDCDYEDIDSLEEGNFQVDSGSDPDYELPKQEVEDLIVHKGLAITYQLETHHGAVFDERNKESHIVELPNQTPVKTVKQHESYAMEHLRELELNFFEKKSASNASLSDDECPNLIPIEEDDEGFQLWTSGITMDDEIFSDDELVEDSDESSTLSYSDVNRKYVQHLNNSSDSSDMEDDEEEESKNTYRMQAVITDATKACGDEIRTFGESSISEIEEQQPNLEEIISTVNNSSQPSNAKILEAALEYNDEECATESDTINEEQYFEEFETRQLRKDFKKRSSLVNDHKAKIEDESAEQSLSTSHNLDSRNSSTNGYLTAEMDVDSSEEADESVENSKAQNETRIDDEINVDQSNEADCTTSSNVFFTKFCNSIDSYYVLVLLKSPFFIYGTIKARLIAGSTEIYGYKLKPYEMVTIHSPRGCSAVPLKPTLSLPTSQATEDEVNNRIFESIEALSDEAEFSPREVKKLLSAYDSMQDAILIVTRNEAASKIKHIFHQHVNENLYPAYIPQSRPYYSTETVLDCMVNTTAEYALQIPPKWHELRLTEDSKCMLIGGKSVGKSTLLRYLLNKHLADFPCVLVIDLDIGQSEIFVPQTVSCSLIGQPLLGPGFFNQIQPDKAYAVGQTNLVLCAHAYMRAVLSLLEYCKTESVYKDIPWLINTMGYNKGFGGELISVICAHLKPTDIIQLQSNRPINNFDMLFEPCVVGNMPRNIYNEPEYGCLDTYEPKHKLHIIPSAIQQESRYQREWQMSAKDMRYIMLLARLSAVLPDEGEWINNSETFCHDLQKLKIVNLTAQSYNETETLKSLESNLVYLCYSNTATSKTEGSNQDSQRIEALECLGIGIVRGIDHHAKQIFIMPAMPKQKLHFVNCLALGEMPLPGSLLTAQNPETKQNVPFVQVMNDEATSRAVKQFFYRT